MFAVGLTAASLLQLVGITRDWRRAISADFWAVTESMQSESFDCYN